MLAYSKTVHWCYILFRHRCLSTSLFEVSDKLESVAIRTLSDLRFKICLVKKPRDVASAILCRQIVQLFDSPMGM